MEVVFLLYALESQSHKYCINWICRICNFVYVFRCSKVFVQASYHGRFVNLRSVEILKAIGSLLGETCSVLRYKLAFPGGSEPQVSLRNN